jgi:hypothetical protein
MTIFSKQSVPSRLFFFLAPKSEIRKKIKNKKINKSFSWVLSRRDSEKYLMRKKKTYLKIQFPARLEVSKFF